MNTPYIKIGKLIYLHISISLNKGGVWHFFEAPILLCSESVTHNLARNQIIICLDFFYIFWIEDKQLLLHTLDCPTAMIVMISKKIIKII